MAAASDEAIGGSESEFEYEMQSSEGGSFGGYVEDAVDEDDLMVIEPPEVRKDPFLVMSLEEVASRQKKYIEDASELFVITHGEAFMLLRQNAWDIGRIQESWFENEEKVRRGSGLAPSMEDVAAEASPSSSSGVCPICISSSDTLVSLSCGHGFCEDCWRGYLHNAIDDGKACVQVRCPQHKCPRVVDTEYFRRFCDADRLKKYNEWYVRSYVDDNPNVKWCPNPAGCGYAIECNGADASGVCCECTFVSCWTCGEEAHRPASCARVNEWNIKNSAESENISWIRVNTKQCPKCHKPIEKITGCNHMVCSKAGGCGHEFCWLCLKAWSLHASSTGGYYQCNIYEKQKKDGVLAEQEKSRQETKHLLDRYMFHFERFMNHDRGMKLTKKQEQDVETKVQTLHDKHGFEIVELQFLYDALKQVRECRRALKWSYVYGYYLTEPGPEKNLFEHLQTNLEEKTDNLHEKLERDFEDFFAPKGDEPKAADTHSKFMEFRMHVTNFTNVTQKFLTQILKDLGHGGNLTSSAGSAFLSA